MEDKRSTLEEAKFPYYALRTSVWPIEDRRRLLWVSGAWSILAALFSIYVTISARQQEQTMVLAAVVAITLGVGAFTVRVLSGVILDRAIEHSDEPKRAAACLKVIEDSYASPETRAALRSSAEGGASAAGTRSLLPIALLTIIATIGASGLSSLLGWVVLGIGLIVLLSFALAVEYANADIIILRALDEYTRRHPPTPPQAPTPDQVLVALGALLAERLIRDQSVNPPPAALVASDVGPSSDKVTSDTEAMSAVQSNNGTGHTSPAPEDDARG